MLCMSGFIEWFVHPSYILIVEWPLCSSYSSGCWTATPSQLRFQRRVLEMRGLWAPRLLTVHRLELPELWNSSTPCVLTQAPSSKSKRRKLLHPPPSKTPSSLCFPLLNLIPSSLSHTLSITNCLFSLQRTKARVSGEHLEAFVLGCPLG